MINRAEQNFPDEMSISLEPIAMNEVDRIVVIAEKIHAYIRAAKLNAKVPHSTRCILRNGHAGQHLPVKSSSKPTWWECQQALTR